MRVNRIIEPHMEDLPEPTQEKPVEVPNPVEFISVSKMLGEKVVKYLKSNFSELKDFSLKPSLIYINGKDTKEYIVEHIAIIKFDSLLNMVLKIIFKCDGIYEYMLEETNEKHELKKCWLYGSLIEKNNLKS